jgi:predicted PurR-regulated permease PerM
MGAVLVVVLGALSLVVLVVLVLALIRQVRDLSASLRRFQDEVRPALEEFQAASLRAREHSDRLSDRAAHIRKAGTPTPGARLRG